MQPGHAEIVGAGFGGLVAAIGLREGGWTVRVHERRATLQGEGYEHAHSIYMPSLLQKTSNNERVLSSRAIGECPAATSGDTRLPINGLPSSVLLVLV